MAKKKDENVAKNKKALINALTNNNGHVSRACEDVGISRTMYYNYLNSDPEFKAEIDAIEDNTIELVEQEMLNRIFQGSDKLIEFYLKTKAKKKGYGANIDVTSNGASVVPPTINVILGKKKPEE